MLNLKYYIGSVYSPVNLFFILVLASMFAPNTEYLAALGLAFWLGLSFLYSDKYSVNVQFLKQPEVLCLATFSFYCLISLLWSPWDESEMIIKEIVRVAIVLGLVLLFSFMVNDKNILSLDTFWIVLLFFVGGYLIIVALSTEVTTFRQYQIAVTRPGLFYHHAPVGWMFGALMLLAFSRMFSAGFVSRLFMLAVTLVAGIVLILAQARGAYLGLGIGVVALGLQKGGETGIAFVLMLLAVVVVFAGTYFFGDIALVQSLVKRADSGRIEIFTTAYSLIVNEPWFGYGFGASPINVMEQNIAMHFHSVYVSVLYYGGIVGGVLMLLILITGLTNCFRVEKAHGWYAVFVMGAGIYLIDGNHFITYPSAELFVFLVPLLISVAIRTRLRYGY